MKATIYHNPRCSKSRETLGILETKGIDAEVVLYLETPPSRDTLVDLIARMGVAPRDLLREGEPMFKTLGLSDPNLSDEALIDAMIAHPVLMNRPIVVTPNGAKLCRPVEAVLDLL